MGGSHHHSWDPIGHFVPNPRMAGGNAKCLLNVLQEIPRWLGIEGSALGSLWETELERNPGKELGRKTSKEQLFKLSHVSSEPESRLTPLPSSFPMLSPACLRHLLITLNLISSSPPSPPPSLIFSFRAALRPSFL